MADSPLQMARKWKGLFEEGKSFIECEKLEEAVSRLNEALLAIEDLDREGSTSKGGPEDLRIAETLERLAFANHRLNRCEEAELQYRRALNILEGRVLGYLTELAAAHNLADLLDATQRSEEAEALRASHPAPEPRSDDEEVAVFDSVEFAIMLALSNLAQFREEPSVIALMEELLVHVENVFGTNSPDTVEAVTYLGWVLASVDVSKAAAYFERGLAISLGSQNPNKEQIATCLHALSKLKGESPLGRAFKAKARIYDKELGNQGWSDSLASAERKLTGAKETPDMVLKEADRLIGSWKKEHAGLTVPYVTMEMSATQRYEQLSGIIIRALTIAESKECDAENPPLELTALLAEGSRCYKELGKIEQAKALKEREMQLISKYWGEGHLMMVEALESYEEL